LRAVIYEQTRIWSASYKRCRFFLYRDFEEGIVIKFLAVCKFSVRYTF